MLKCEAKSQCLYSMIYDDKEIDKLLHWADIIYVGGGDTISMMKIWKQHRLDEKLKNIMKIMVNNTL